ncbi:MAG: hypothetical protein D6734_02410 [Candidatus Schekmanbacteria bacterium]|nr:MAG: hypothetical protein D6734_02410 [Candidatus Schekmanbacteria bacterium]
MAKIFYSIGRAFEFFGIIFTAIALLLFGKSGSVAEPMTALIIGVFWFFTGWLIVKVAGSKIESKKETDN